MRAPKKKPAKRKQKRAIDKKPAFLAAFVTCASLTEAATAVGINRSLHYQWLDDDPQYVLDYAKARRKAGDTLRDDAVEWARTGVYEPIVYQGEFQYEMVERVVCTLKDGREIFEDELPTPFNADFIESKRTIRQRVGKPLGVYRRSEGLLARTLKAFLPDEFGDKGAIEISGPKGGPIPLDQQRLANLTDEELAALIAVAGKLTESGGDGGGTPPKGA